MLGKQSRGGWWITIAEKDLDAWNSLVLCESLRRTLTTKETCILVTERVSQEMRKLLVEVFDYIIEIYDGEIMEIDKKLESKVPLEVLHVLNLWKCSTKKAVFIHPCSMVLKNCDELFEVKEDFGATVTRGLNLDEVFGTSVFVFRPNHKTYNGMLSYLKDWINSPSNGKITTQQLLNSYFGGDDGLQLKPNGSILPNKYQLSGDAGTTQTDLYNHQNQAQVRLGKFSTKNLSTEYNLVINGTGTGDDCGHQRSFDLENDTKVVHFANETPWSLAEDNDIFVKLWKKMYCETLLEYESKFYENNVEKQGQHKHNIELLLQDYNLSKVLNSLDHKLSSSKQNDLLQQIQIKELEDTISIIGLSCRFPGANNENEFWNLLVEGRDETKPLPAERYFTRETVRDVETPVGYLKCPIEDFDAKFFEISPREAEYMDPQQRLLLEVSWESLENAGINPKRLNGSNTAVFVGLWAQEYAMHLTNESGKGAGQDFTHKYLGNAICASAARISHYLGLRGPSVAMEAGCASALEGVHYACSSLRSHETDLAISCGVNIALGASGEFKTLDSFILSKDGKCKTFDESANGFARGEACVAMIFKRTSDAIRDGDKILGVIRGSALNSDGSGSTLGTPNAVAQELVLNEALKNSGLSPNDISYVEAHGTGTPIGDPIEFHALNKVFSGHGRTQPLFVSSVKTNIGHTEGASGMSGLVKVLLCLRNRMIPKHLHLKNLNPYIKLDEIPAVIPSENTELKPTSNLGLIAGVSSFGLSGTNVHVIVQEAPEISQKYCNRLMPTNMERNNHILVLSAKSEIALNDLVSKYISMLESSTSNLNLADLAYSANTGRAHFRHRLAVVSKDSNQLLRCLENNNYFSKKVVAGVAKAKVAFLFTGQGSQYLLMAKGLYDSHPIFKSSFDRRARLLKTRYGLDLFQILSYNNDVKTSSLRSDCDILDNSMFSQPAIFCIEICLAELWESFGVVPDFVLGHSVGEFAAAVVAGILSLEDGLKLVVERSKLVGNLERGSMMVVKTSEKITERLIKEFESSVGNEDVWIDIAAINSESEVVVSGGLKPIELFESFCQEKVSSIGTQRLAASHAFHSRDMDLILKDYAEVAKNVVVKNPRYRYISGTFGKELILSDFCSNYWVSHLRQPVIFSKAFLKLLDEGCNVFVEIGPQPVLLGLGMASVTPEKASECIWCPSIRKSEDIWTTVLSSLAKMYVNGLDIDWIRFDSPFVRNRISLPNYPFQREKFWFKGKSRESNSIVIKSKSVHPILGRRIPSPLSDSITYYNSISLETLPYMKDHIVADKVILPAAAYLELVFAAGLDVVSGGTNASAPLALENLTVEFPLELKDELSVQIQTVVTSTNIDDQLKYEVKVYKQVSFDESGSDSGKWKRLVSATFVPCVSISSSGATFVDFEELKSTLNREDNVEDIYSNLAEMGIKFGPLFKSIHAVWYSETEFFIETSLPEGSDKYICHPIILDAMIQSCVASLAINQKDLHGLHLPVLVRKCTTFPKTFSGSISKLYIHSLRSAGSSVDSKFESSCVTLYNEDCQCLAIMEGVDLLQTNVQSLLRLLASDIDEYPGFYEEVWHKRLGPRIRRVDSKYFKHPSLNCPLADELLERINSNWLKKQPLLKAFDELNYLFILRSIFQIGWNYRVGDVVSISDFCAKGSVLPRHIRLMTNWFLILEEEGDVKISKGNPDELTVCKLLCTLEEIEIRILELANSVSDVNEHVEYRFSVNCGEQLAAMLQGKTSPYSVLFPEEKHATGAADLYHKEPIIALLHELGGLLNFLVLQETLEQLRDKGRSTNFVFRVVEIGAGSGSATEFIVDKLNQLNISYEYTLTDISPLFLNEASKKFAHNKNIKYQLLDIERDPKRQGFAPNYFDLVIADNVLHATKNLSETLKNVRHLLVNSGILLLTEQTSPIRLMDVSFAFMEGWWRFNDYEIRPKTPFVRADTWITLLESHGFIKPKEHKIHYEFDYSTFMAFANHETVPLPVLHSVVSEKRNVFLIFGIFEHQFTDEMINLLNMAGTDCVRIYNSKQCKKNYSQREFVVNPCSPNDMRDLIEIISTNFNVIGIIYLWGMLDCLQNSEVYKDLTVSEISGGLLHLLQGLANFDIKSNLYVVTKGAQYVGEQEPSNPLPAILWGILMTFNNEFSNQYATCIDIDPEESNIVNSCLDVFNQLWLNEPEHQIAFRNGKKYVKRLINVDNYKAPLLLPNTDRFKLINPSSGSFNDFLVLAAGTSALQPCEVEIKIACASLNFKDVLLAMRSDDSSESEFGLDMNTLTGAKAALGLGLGLDFSGTICSIRDITNSKFKVGDRVYGCVSGGALASHVVVPEAFIRIIPDHISFEDASTLSCVFLTAIYFLIRVANLTANDKVLIHAASGGVGLAAIQIAQDIGAEIFATAGSKRKRTYLRSLGIKHVYNSRNTLYGKEIESDTNGVAVNVVLNALTGPKFKETTLSVCAHDARFLEMSKLNIWSKEEVASIRPDVVYFIQDQDATDIGSLFTSENEVELIRGLIADGLTSGKYKPLPYTRFPLTRVHDAFRYLQEAKHIGKVVVKMPKISLVDGRIEHKEELFNAYSTYLITGGLGGIGMEVAKWMTSSGAKYIVLVGRSPPSTRAEAIICTLRASDVNILVFQTDVSDYLQCKEILDKIQNPENGFPPLKGIMHAAGVLFDGIIANQSLESLSKVYKSKVSGAWNLHILTKNYILDHFVLFSSLVSSVGGIAQVNHCAANKYLDSFAKFRVQQGLPCISVNWGPWSDVGAAASVKNVEATFGFRMFSPTQGIKSLERALLSQRTNTVVFDLAGNKVLKETYNVGALLDLIKFEEESRESLAQFEHKVKLIKDALPEEREEKIKDFLEFVIRDTLRLPETELLDRDQHFSEIGIDSLMAMELRSKMQHLLSDFDTRSLSIHELQENRTINKLGIVLTRIINEGVSCKVLTKEELVELIKVDCVLPEDIIPRIDSTSSACDFNSVLLTGVTGHLGPYILRDLLQNKPNLKIYCIIRAESDEGAKERLESALDNLDLFDYVSLDTVVCLAGNLALTNFSVTLETYKELLQNIDAIIHCAVVANLSLLYGKFGPNDVRSNNVVALLNILRFATTAKIKPIQFASSVYAISKIDNNGFLPDEFPSDEDFGAGLTTGYHISKFVCEKLLKQAVDRRIPVQVLRHHYLSGDSQTGLIPIQRNHMMMFVLTCQKIKMFPEIDFNMTGVPIDVAASVSVQLFFNPSVEAGVYNINNPKTARLLEVSQLIKERGYRFEIVPYNKWRESALASQGLELAPLIELYVNDLFSSDQFTQHALVKHSLEENTNMFKNSDKLKKYVENIDEMMISPLEMAELHMDYYENTFGKDNMNAFFEVVGNNRKK